MRRILDSIQSILWKVGPWVIFACLAAAMLVDPGRDTLGIASAAFAVTLAFAAVSFSYARTLKEGSAMRDEIVFGGERLVSSAGLFLFASILKHASNDIPRYLNLLRDALPQPEEPMVEVTFFGQHPLTIAIGGVAFMIFMLGLILAEMGIGVVVAVAGRRAKRRPGHDEFFGLLKSPDERFAELQKKDGEEPLDKPPSVI